MKPLSLIAIVLAAFLILLGVSSRQKQGSVLSNAIIVGGVLIAVFVAAVRLVIYIKEKKGK